MHARSDAWRCCDGKGRGTRVQCELFLAATLFSVELWISIDTYCSGKQQKFTSRDHCFVANQRVLFFAMRFLPYKGFALTGHLKTAKCEWLWAASIAMCYCLRSSAENTAEAVTCQGKIYLSQSKNRQFSTALCSKSVKTFSEYAFMHTAVAPVEWRPE